MEIDYNKTQRNIQINFHNNAELESCTQDTSEHLNRDLISFRIVTLARFFSFFDEWNFGQCKWLHLLIVSVNGICGIHRRGALFFFFISLFIQECRYFFCMKIVQFLRCAWVYYRFQRLFRLFKVLRILYTTGALHISMKRRRKKNNNVELRYFIIARPDAIERWMIVG